MSTPTKEDNEQPIVIEVGSGDNKLDFSGSVIETIPIETHPSNPVNPTINTTNGVGIGPDGVLQIYPTNPKNKKEWYMDMSNPEFNTISTNISFGHGSHIKSYKSVKNNIRCYTTHGSPLTYNSGPDGNTVRLDIYGDKNWIWSNKTKYSYRTNPGYLMAPGGFRSVESTIYLMVEEPFTNGGHEACAFKWGGRDEDQWRSLIEIGYATGSAKDVFGNVNFAHFPYDPIKPVKVYFSGDKLTVNKWVGLKAVCIVSQDRSYNWLAMYVDLDPFDSVGKPKNNWKLKAEMTFSGHSSYGHYIKTWESQKDLWRIDGFKTVNFALMSIREIDVSNIKPLSNQHVSNNSEFTLINNTDTKMHSDFDLGKEEIEKIKKDSGGNIDLSIQKQIKRTPIHT